MKSFNKDELPVYNMLLNAFKNEKVSFHMPGHNRLKSYPKSFRKKLLALDTTELDTTDDLNNPQNAKSFQNALNRAQSVFSSSKTFFVTTGASVAIHAAILSLTSQNDKIIAYNNSHQSLINACIMFNLKLVFTDQENLSDTIKEHSDAKLIFATYPDYTGDCINLNYLISQTRESNMKIVIDESHGTHLPFSPLLLPNSSLYYDVDLVIHSAHKTTPALTQGAFLHITKSFVERNSKINKDCLIGNISNSLSIVTTSSPSFLISASLDYSVYYLSRYGNNKISNLFKNINYFVKSLPLEFKSIISNDYQNFILGKADKSDISFDFTKLILDFKDFNFSTNEIHDHLKSDGINIEYKDYSKLVLLCNIENTKNDFKRLSKSLNKFLKLSKLSNQNFYKNNNALNTKTESKLSEYYNSRINEIYSFEYFNKNKLNFENISLKECLNKISYSKITPYPPGIPLLIPGQKISKDAIDLISLLLNSGININGIHGNPDYFIKCIK